MPTREVEVGSAEGTGDYVIAATFLPVRRWRHLLPLFRMSRRVEKQLSQTPGLVRYGLKAELRRKQFWTYSVWQDRGAMGAFMRTEPHASAIQRLNEWAGRGVAFTNWESSDGSIDWTEARKRLTDAAGRDTEPD